METQNHHHIPITIHDLFLIKTGLDMENGSKSRKLQKVIGTFFLEQSNLMPTLLLVGLDN